MMSLTLVSSARPREPPGWRLAKSRAVKWRASTRAMARASPMTSMAVVLEVGARFSGQASRETPVSSTMSEYLAREEAVLPVMEMMGSSKRLMKGSRASSSEVSPEKDIAMQTSPSWTMPRSPCRAFRESSRTVGVPVEFRVATIFGSDVAGFAYAYDDDLVAAVQGLGHEFHSLVEIVIQPGQDAAQLFNLHFKNGFGAC